MKLFLRLLALLERYRVFLLAGGILAAAVFYVVSLRGYVFVTLGALMLIMVILKLEDKALKLLLLLTLFIRLGALLAINAGLVSLPGDGGDILAFERYGWEYAEAWRSGLEYRPQGAYVYYSALIGAVYFVFGRYQEAPQMVNVVFGLLLVAVIYWFAMLLAGRQVLAVLAGLLAACFTPLVLYSVILHREIFILLGLTASFFLLARWSLRGAVQDFLGSALLIFGVSLFHTTLIVLGLVPAILFLVYQPQKKCFGLEKRALIVVGVLSVFTVLLLNSGLFVYKVPSGLEYFSLQGLENQVTGRLVGRTQYLEGMVPGSYWDVIWQTPVRIAYLLFTPFPSMIKTAGDIYVFLEVFVYLLLIVLALRGLFNMLRFNPGGAAGLILSLILVASIYAWGTANVGTAWRHRAKVAPLLMVTATLGLGAKVSEGLERFTLNGCSWTGSVVPLNQEGQKE